MAYIGNIGLDRGFYRDTQGVCRDNVDRDYVRVVVEWKRNRSDYFGFRVGRCPNTGESNGPENGQWKLVWGLG